MENTRQCAHMVSNNKHAKRRCEQLAGDDGYCGRHRNHPDRRNERALALMWEHNNKMAQNILGRLADIAMDDDSTPGDSIRAGTAFLDRTGHGPNATMSEEEATRIAQATIELIRERGGNSDGTT